MTTPVRPMARRFTSLDVLALCAWFGLVTGIGEVLMLAGIKLSTGRFAFVSQDAVWMAPLAYAALVLVVPGVLLVVIVPRIPERHQWPIAIGVLATLGAALLLLMVPGFDPRGLRTWRFWV